ncbi:MAG: proton-conducting transporter membrane subunit [Candidatus Altiarchaeota archaeon]|nr:proton-conducting transporter membrane subunit [Candidatus Altiarchaeota archaeon]
MLQYYVVSSLLALIALSLARSCRTMNALSIAHSAAYLALSLYALLYAGLPEYYSAEQYLFIDHLGAYEILIAAAIFLLAAVYSGGYVESLARHGEFGKGSIKLFYIGFNILLFVTAMAFMSNNLALFWIFTELTTFFSALLIAIRNSRKNIDASLKYIFVTSIAMLFSFIGLIFLFAFTQRYFSAGTLTWSVLMLHAQALPQNIMMVVFAFTFIGFAAKAGIAPFHTWLPHAHSKAPSQISAVLSAVLLNVGLYGILRMYSIARQTMAAGMISSLLIAFGLLSILIAAFSMLQQKNLKRLIAFSSIENMGLILMGVGIGTPLSIFWALFHTLAHSLTKALIFLSAGILHSQYASSRIERMKDLFRLQPLASWCLIIGSAAITGMPPSMVFLSKLSLLIQIGGASPILLAIVLLLFLAASSAFAIFLLTAFSQTGGEHAQEKPYAITAGMKISLAVLVVVIIAVGLYFPDFLENSLNTIATELGFQVT